MSTFVVIGIAVAVYMTVWFVIAAITKRNDLADIAWGLGFVGIGWITYALQVGTAEHMLWMAVLVTIWGVRLATHIGVRNAGKPEDARYRAWREAWSQKGATYFLVRSWLQVFVLQGALMYVIALPLMLVSRYGNQDIGWLFVLGLLVWVIGFIFESVGDAQLVGFLKQKDRQASIMTRGLWRYTRHPNYFGEVTQWWGIFVMSLCAISFPLSLVGVVSPLMITYLIIGLSGIPMLERRWRGNPEFEVYKKRTSAFFPWFPRS